MFRLCAITSIFSDGFSLTHGSRAQGNLFALVAVVAIVINTMIIKPRLEKLRRDGRLRH